MIQVKKRNINFISLAILSLLIITTIIGLIYNNARAANTLSGANEIITINDTTDGQPVNASIHSTAYSGDGNIILFSSDATNLVNSSGVGGIYTYNIRTNTTTRIDKSVSGITANGGRWGGSYISESGRYITFGSMATNLIDGTTTDYGSYFKRDNSTGAITRFAGGWSNGISQNWDKNLGISNDGRFLLVASRYIQSEWPRPYGIVRGEDTSGSYSWTNIASGGDSGTGSNGATNIVGGISCDGVFAAYQNDRFVELADFRKSTVTKINVGSYNSTSPAISCNGRYVLYATTNRTQITTPSGMNTKLHLTRYDRITGERIYIDTNSTGVVSLGVDPGGTGTGAIENAFSASIADTGDAVFTYNGSAYIKHLSDGSGTLEPIAKKADGTYYTGVASGKITTDGRYVFFQTDPYNLGLAASPSSSQIIRAKTNL